MGRRRLALDTQGETEERKEGVPQEITRSKKPASQHHTPYLPDHTAFTAGGQTLVGGRKGKMTES